MPATELTKACARSLKAWAKSLGLTNVSTECGKSVITRPQYVSIRIRPEPCSNWRDPLVYKSEFPHADRSRALIIIYGRDLSTGGRACTGNIDQHSMAMHDFEWVKFFEGTRFAVTITPASIEEAPVH